MSYILLTCPDADGIVIETMEGDALLEHIKEMDKEGIQYRFLDRIPKIVNGQLITEPFYTDEELKKGWMFRSGISFAIIIKGKVVGLNEVLQKEEEKDAF